MNSDWQSRTRILIGEEKVKRLRQAHVAVIGLGGVGGTAAEMIARAGVGKMTILDSDSFDDSNRNRQAGAFLSTTGRAKTDVMAERLRDINPDLQLTALNRYLETEKVRDFLDSIQPCDCVIDAIDSIAPKVKLLECAVTSAQPVVSCMGSGNRLNPELVRCADISKTDHCPLARTIRQRLRKCGIVSGVTVIFSPECAPEEAVCETGDFGPNKRSVIGTISYMPVLFGCHCAAAAIRMITGQRN